MGKIRMKSRSDGLTLEEAFREFVVSQKAKGIKDVTIRTYHNHFHSASKHLNMSLTFGELTSQHLDEMPVSIRESGLAPNSVSSSTRVMKPFLLFVFSDHSGLCRDTHLLLIRHENAPPMGNSVFPFTVSHRGSILFFRKAGGAFDIGYHRSSASSSSTSSPKSFSASDTGCGEDISTPAIFSRLMGSVEQPPERNFL